MVVIRTKRKASQAELDADQLQHPLRLAREVSQVELEIVKDYGQENTLTQHAKQRAEANDPVDKRILKGLQDQTRRCQHQDRRQTPDCRYF